MFVKFAMLVLLKLTRSIWASLVGQLVNNLPTMRETWVRSLGGEDPLEKGWATHSSILGLKLKLKFLGHLI